MKKIIFASLLLSILSCGVNKNLPSKKSDVAEKYMNTITSDELKKHLTIIASDDMEGRDSGSKGQKKAGLYLVNQYKSNNVAYPTGAKNYFQTIPKAYLKSKYNHKFGDSENVWAFVEGSEKPEEILVISAHYDHIGIEDGEVFNGADDDGSGTVALLEIAQAFQLAKKDGKGPKRSILFLHVTGEEHGLHGSRFYTENPLFPLKNTITDINIDMIGRRDDFHKESNNYVYVIGSDFLATDLYNITENANKNYVNINLDYKYNSKTDSERFYYRSDHYNFAKNNIPSVFLFNGIHEDYHKATDEVSKIEFDALTKRTQLAFAMAWDLANRENRPIVDKKGE